MRADLHIHTTASDGWMTPEKVLEEASQAGLAYISITDHDTVDGFLRLTKTAGSISPVVIPGIEFSTDLPGHEVHILGYYINPCDDELRHHLDILAKDRLARVCKMISKLKNLGYNLDYDFILEIAGPKTVVGRPHVAQALVAKGYFKAVKDVFDTLIERGGPAYVPHYKLPPQAVVSLIERAGGIPVLAHPGLVGSDSVVNKIIAAGVKGLEVYHPSHDEGMTTRYLALARQRKLKVTGGSDYHAIPGRFPGKLGEFTVSGSLVRELRA